MRLHSLLVAAALQLPFAAAAATTFSIDASDLWFNADESGWGVNIEQQDDIVFLTLFVYGADGKPTWFVASAMQGQKSGTAVSYSGDLYATTGPAFNAAFDPGAVTRSKVGTATLDVVNGSDGTLTYTVNGVRILKKVTRQTWRENDASGNYIGYLAGSCVTTTSGPEESMTFSIVQAMPTFQMNSTGTSGVSCGYSGTYVQEGRLGRASGTVSCSNGRTGAFTLDAIEASPEGMISRLSTQVGTCTLTSRLAGIRRN